MKVYFFPQKEVKELGNQEFLYLHLMTLIQELALCFSFSFVPVW